MTEIAQEQTIVGDKMASELKNLNRIKNHLSNKKGEQRANLAMKEAILEETNKDDQNEQGKFSFSQNYL